MLAGISHRSTWPRRSHRTSLSSKAGVTRRTRNACNDSTTATTTVNCRDAQRLLQASFLGCGNFAPPLFKKTYKFLPPNGYQIVCSEFFVSAETMNYKHITLMDNKPRKLFVVKQSKWCKFMSQMHRPDPLGERMRSVSTVVDILRSNGSLFARNSPRFSRSRQSYCLYFQ